MRRGTMAPVSNIAQARSLISAARNSGPHRFGIYREWSTLFGSTSFNLDSSVPLWFATYDNVETLRLGTPFEGWTTAVGTLATNSPTNLPQKEFDNSICQENLQTAGFL